MEMVFETDNRPLDATILLAALRSRETQGALVHVAELDRESSC